MSAKTKNIISMALNVMVVACTAYAMLPFFLSSGDGNMKVRGLASLRYFTNLSNWLMAFAAASFLPVNVRNMKTGDNTFPSRRYIFKFTATVAVTVTLLTCVLFLAPVNVLKLAPRGIPAWKAYAMMFSGNTFFLHFLTPLLSILSTVFFERTEGFGRKEWKWGLLPVVLYAAVYIVMVAFVGAENGGWRDFYGFTFGGRMYLAPVSGAVMLFATWFISLCEGKLHERAEEGPRLRK